MASAHLDAYQEQGALPAGQPAPPSAAALHRFLAGAQPEACIALHAYLQPTPEIEAALQALRLHLRDRCRLAVTLGYGPRFLHSTGQLHKGDAGRGLFVQLTADATQDAPIPDQAGAPESSISFGALKMAQARATGRRCARPAGASSISTWAATSSAACGSSWTSHTLYSTTSRSPLSNFFLTNFLVTSKSKEV